MDFRGLCVRWATKGDWGTPQKFIKKVGVVNLTIPDLFIKQQVGYHLLCLPDKKFTMV